MATILIVEDDCDLRMALADVLADLGHVVVAAANGAEALETLQALVPDVILLDLNMPVMSGQELLRHRETSPALSAIPVIVLSAQTDWFAAPNVALIISKPVKIERLGQAIEKVVGEGAPRLVRAIG